MINFEHAGNFLDQLDRLASRQQIGAAFDAFIRPFGFVCVSAGQTRTMPDGTDWEFFFNTWPAEWLQIYQKRNYVRIDPMPTLARLGAHPFTWQDNLDALTVDPARREFHDWIVSLGVSDGFAVPVHYPGDDLGLCVCVAGRLIGGATERRALQLIALCVMQKCRELGGAGIEAASGESPLSAREIECMRWVIGGKSDRDIGQILGISHTTVHFHVERVKKKLGVRTRTQAASLVVSLGML
jgi:DNA-binding CsgD family transcriptional regulator